MDLLVNTPTAHHMYEIYCSIVFVAKIREKTDFFKIKKTIQPIFVLRLNLSEYV
jgi:hypothetical protein